MNRFLLIIICFSCYSSFASGIGELYTEVLKQDILNEEVSSFEECIQPASVRPTAMLITILTGPFGGHRIYLGTSEKVPIFYALTLGGGLGILPLIDLICISFTKDLSRYYGNNKIFMWAP